MRPSSLALHRLIISAAPRFPDLGPSIYDAGAARMVDDLARLIKKQCRAGKIAVADPQKRRAVFWDAYQLLPFSRAHGRQIVGQEFSTQKGR